MAEYLYESYKYLTNTPIPVVDCILLLKIALPAVPLPNDRVKKYTHPQPSRTERIF